MKKPQTSPDTSPKAEPAPRPVCECCGFVDPVGGVNIETGLCDLCFASTEIKHSQILLAFYFNRIRRDILSGHES